MSPKKQKQKIIKNVPGVWGQTEKGWILHQGEMQIKTELKIIFFTTIFIYYLWLCDDNIHLQIAVLESMFLEKGVQSGVPGHGRGKHQQTGDSSNNSK